MSSASSAQHWDTSHLNVPIRKMTKQRSIEDKEVYLREGVFLTKKKATIQLTIQKKKYQSKSVKTGGSSLANWIVRFRLKVPELLDSTTKASKWHLTNT
jgi:hypothetical protein